MLKMTGRPADSMCSYEGVFTKRTGDRSDGLAMFWRINAMQPGVQGFNQPTWRNGSPSFEQAKRNVCAGLPP